MLGKLAACLLIWTALFGLFSSKVFAAINIDSISPNTISSTNDVITLSISASNLDNKPQYLQVGITPQGKTNYFGLTRNNSDQWIKYQSTPSDLSSLYTFTPSSGAWSGQLQVKVDSSDTAFSGAGTYSLKLLKYISSPTSHTDSNIVTFNVSMISPPPPISTSPSPSPSPTPSPSTASNTTKLTPTINFSPLSSVPVGSTYTLPIQASNLPSASYYIKVRIGPDENHLTHGQTYNNSWLDDNDSWTNFQLITPDGSGSWQGSINTRLPNGEATGNDKIQIRLKKSTTDTTYESDIKNISFSASLTPPPPPPSSKSTTSPTTNSVKTTSIVAPPSLISGEILGLSTQSAASSSSATSSDSALSGASTNGPPPPPAMNLKIASQKRNNSALPLSQLIVSFGLFLLGFGGVVFWRLRGKSI